MRWFWLSFADPSKPEGEQFLGATVLAVDEELEEMIDTLDPSDRISLLRERGQEEAVPFYVAVQMTHFLKINPGGEVQGFEFPEEAAFRIPPKMLGKLHSREEWEAAGVPLRPAG